MQQLIKQDYVMYPTISGAHYMDEVQRLVSAVIVCMSSLRITGRHHPDGMISASWPTLTAGIDS